MKKILVILLCLLSLTVNARKRYVSVRGSDSNDGVDSSATGAWLTLQHAGDNIIAGDTLYLMKGIWYVTGTTAVMTLSTNSGTAANPICIFNYPGQTPIIDGSLRHPPDWNGCFNLVAVNFIHFRGIEIRNFWQPTGGVNAAGAIGATNCTNVWFENMIIHDIGGSGIRYFGAWKYPGEWSYPAEGFEVSTWNQALIDHGYAFPAQESMTYDSVKFINCDVYNVCDSISQAVGPGGSADGIKYDNEIGSVAIVQGCRAWNCSDDGFDFSGSGTVLFNNCWAVGNGRLAGGDGTGFKNAYPRQYIDTSIRTLKNCIAANNRNIGFAIIVDDDYPCMAFTYYNTLAYHNDRGFVDSYGYGCDNLQPMIYRNNVSYGSHEVLGQEIYSFKTGGTHDHNSWDSEVTITDDDFVLIDSAHGISQLTDSRKADNSLPDITFLRLATGSDLIGAGTYVGMSATPDMGIDWAYLDAGEAPSFAPVVTNIPNQTITTGSSFATINLDNYVSDADNTDSQITWTYSGDTHINISITNRVATITYDNGFTGSETITFTATDPDNLSDSDQAVFTVNAASTPSGTCLLRINYAGSKKIRQGSERRIGIN